MKHCDELTALLLLDHTFDVVGGCGYNPSGSVGECMGDIGLWFAYCPFCGKKIIKQRTSNSSWKWFEERRVTERRRNK